MIRWSVASLDGGTSFGKVHGENHNPTHPGSSWAAFGLHLRFSAGSFRNGDSIMDIMPWLRMVNSGWSWIICYGWWWLMMNSGWHTGQRFLIIGSMIFRWMVATSEYQKFIDGKHPMILLGFQNFGGAGFRWPIRAVWIPARFGWNIHGELLFFSGCSTQIR